MYEERCPYCDSIIEIDHNDGYGFEQDEAHQQQCPKCEKYFVYFTDITYWHKLQKAECLNEEGKHEWEPTITYPKISTRMRCKHCYEERKPTQEEMKKIMGDTEGNGILL